MTTTLSSEAVGILTGTVVWFGSVAVAASGVLAPKRRSFCGSSTSFSLRRTGNVMHPRKASWPVASFITPSASSLARCSFPALTCLLGIRRPRSQPRFVCRSHCVARALDFGCRSVSQRHTRRQLSGKESLRKRGKTQGIGNS